MKSIQLFHNPGAGDEGHTKDDLLALLKQHGYECRYISTSDKTHMDFDVNSKLLIVAGGDGTVRGVVEQLIKKVAEKAAPIALLPLGTANNISRTLGLSCDTEEVIRSWKDARVKAFDVGKVFNVPGADFFLESFGYGIFPKLMEEMDKQAGATPNAPEEKIRKAQEVLHRIVQEYVPRHCRLEVDGTDHSGNLIMAEIMNTRSIGPNLSISPLADPGDGEFEVVLVPEQHKDKFAAYLSAKINGREETYSFHTLKGRNITISWDGTDVHVDDKTVQLEKAKEVKLTLQHGLLEFIVPDQS